MSFEETIETLRAQRDANDPVAIAKRELAATRNAVIEALAEFDAVATTVQPIVDDAYAKWDRAGALGVVYKPLHTAIQDAFYMLGSRPAIANIPNAIDSLNKYSVVALRSHKAIPVQLGQLRANIGALREAPKRIANELAVLERLLQERLAQPMA